MQTYSHLLMSRHQHGAGGHQRHSRGDRLALYVSGPRPLEMLDVAVQATLAHFEQAAASKEQRVVLLMVEGKSVAAFPGRRDPRRSAIPAFTGTA